MSSNNIEYFIRRVAELNEFMEQNKSDDCIQQNEELKKIKEESERRLKNERHLKRLKKEESERSLTEEEKKIIEETDKRNKEYLDQLDQERLHNLNFFKKQLNTFNDTSKLENTKLFDMLIHPQKMNYKDFMECLETEKIDFPENNFDIPFYNEDKFISVPKNWSTGKHIASKSK